MNIYNLPTEKTIAETIILANGEFPTHSLPLSILEKGQYIVCCDGAINQLSQTNIIPSAIVGDCDSLTDDNRLKYKDILHPDKDQETNDLTKSIHFCINQGRKDIIILGATGKREDHTLANISLLAEHLHRANLRMITNLGVFTAITEDTSFDSFEGQQVSLFSIDHSPITSINLKYPVENRTFDNWWQGSLNESLNDKFTIKTKNRIIIYQSF